MLGTTNQIFKKLFYAGIVASVLLAGAAGKAMSAPDSNSIIVDNIELYVETDKSFYYLGENVEILYRLTKLGFPSATIPCMEIPPINIIVIKDGQTIRQKHPLRYQGPIDLRLMFWDPCEITFTWDMNDFNDVPVEPGIYDVLGVISDTIGLPDIGIQITILPEPRTITVGLGAGYDFNTIQAAINDANDGDTIIVADGTYTGNGNRDIDFLGKAITMSSENGPQNCIIDCQGSGADRHRGFYFHSSEETNSVVDGFTITNGYGPIDDLGEFRNSAGGAIFCSASSPTINDCVILSNSASNGGGICCCRDAAPTIRNSTIRNNSGLGGGIYCLYSSPHITNCVITDNVAPLVPGTPGAFATSGGGIASELSSPIIENCIISDNTATDRGGGIKCYTGGDPRYSPTFRNCIITGNTAYIGGALYRCRGPITNCTICYNSASLRGGGVYDCGSLITNCIIWGNGDDLYLSYATYSCIEDLDPGTGNIHVDPCFADLNNGDYHLKSQAGRWEPNSQTWVQDEVTSPCIDGGNPEDPIGNEPFPNGGVINMGAYGGTAEASKSYFGGPVCEIIVAGDVNGDCIVNYKDFALMALHWLEER